MNTSMPTDEVAAVLRRSYQVVVDQTELPSDRLPVHGLTPPPSRRRFGWAAAALGVVGVVALGAIALLTENVPPAESPRVERIAVGEAPPDLGGEPTVLNSDVSSDAFDPAPPIDMWHWRSGDGPTEWVVLLETALDADLSSVLGSTDAGDLLVPPSASQVESATLELGWFVRSWVDREQWRIAVGYGEASVAELATAVAGNSPSNLEMSGFDLIYEGPQNLYPSDGVELSELFYTSPAGGFSLHLMRGWEHGTTAGALRSPNIERADVNGSEAVIAGDAINWWIAWAIDDRSTALIQSSDLEPDVLEAIAESVEPVSREEWDRIANSASTADPDDSSPTAESFTPVDEAVVLASGDEWAVKSQAVVSDEDAAEPDRLGLCGWVEVDGQVSIDFGCSINTFGQRLPVRVSTPDGPVVIGELRTEVTEVRFEGTSVAVQVSQIHPEIPFGWFAIQVPADTTLSEYTFWAEDGRQLPIDPRTQDQMSGRVHSIS